jgi:hypothetical protein
MCIQPRWGNLIWVDDGDLARIHEDGTCLPFVPSSTAWAKVEIYRNDDGTYEWMEWENSMQECGLVRELDGLTPLEVQCLLMETFPYPER